MTHMRQAHGGFVTQAKRRGEEYALCGTCGQRSHRFQAAPVERVTPLRIAGLTIFLLALFGAIVYALPIVLIGAGVAS